MAMLFRKQLSESYQRLALRSLAKHKTKLIVLYGWDWVEGLREATYQLLATRVNCRRNYDWIRWDLGLPLFILGYSSALSQNKIVLLWSVLRAALSLSLKKNIYQDYLVVSLNAKNDSTLQYWLPILEKAEIVILPIKEDFKSQAATIMKSVPAQNFVDLRQIAKDNLQKKRVKSIETEILDLLTVTAESLPTLKSWQFGETELHDAVLKVDWQRFVWERIRFNLQKNTAE